MTMDANLRYLPKGVKFKAKFHSCVKDSEPYNVGFRTGMVVTGTMLDGCTDDPRVALDYMDGNFEPKTLTLREWRNFSSYWLVFEGCADGQ